MSEATDGQEDQLSDLLVFFFRCVFFINLPLILKSFFFSLKVISFDRIPAPLFIIFINSFLSEMCGVIDYFESLGGTAPK